MYLKLFFLEFRNNIYGPEKDLTFGQNFGIFMISVLISGYCVVNLMFRNSLTRDPRWSPNQNYVPFSSYIDQSALIESLQNSLFTLSNFRNSPTLTLIDRFLASKSVLEKFANALVRRLDRHISDHFPILLSIGVDNWGPTPFRFKDMWLQHHSFFPLAKYWWKNTPIRGCPGHGFIQ